jgi:predicted nucleic acid-binding protein
VASVNPQKAAARQAIKSLLRKGADLCLAPQNVVEFWAVCTRPRAENGLEKTIAAADRYCRFMESFVTILAETPAIFAEWRSLVVSYQVSGKKAHDARIVAAMKVHGLRRILTFNTDDFTRYVRVLRSCTRRRLEQLEVVNRRRDIITFEADVLPIQRGGRR